MFPNYKVITFRGFETLEIIDSLLQSDINWAPCYVNLKEVGQDKIMRVLTNISQALQTIKTSIIAPYPFYIIYPHKVICQDLNLVESKADLPVFYKCKVLSKLNSKQMSLVRKCSSLSEKIKNENPSEILTKFTDNYKRQGELMTFCCEIDFLERIEKNLIKNEEDAII